MAEQKGELFESDDDYINMLNIMEAIIGTSYELGGDAAKRVYKEVVIDPELCFALNHARVVHPRMKIEVDEMIRFLEEQPNLYWSQDDDSLNFKVFKYVNTKNRWHQVINKLSGKDVSGNFKYLKIAFLENQTSSYFPEGIALGVKEHLVEKMGQDWFDARREAFKKWFKLGKKGTYYIYVPK